MTIRGMAQRSPEDVRARIEQLIQGANADYSALSRLLGRNAAYLQQYVKRGTPAKLDEDDRLRLAQFFGVDERELGAREPWSPPGRRGR